MQTIFKKFIYAGLSLLLIIGVFLAIVAPVVDHKNKVLSKHDDKYNVVLSLKYGYLDKGFNQQAIEGVCQAFDVPVKSCNGKNKLFQEGKISYGYAGTMDSIALIKEYVDNFAETEKIDYFITPGFTYTNFLQKWLFEDRQYFRQKGINFISIGTGIGLSDGEAWPENFWQILFEEYLPGYYAGLYAGAYALMNPDQFKDGDLNKKGKQIRFAALGGLWIPPIARYALGFKLGVSDVNKQKDQFTDNAGIEVLFTDYQTTGSFDNTTQSKFDSARIFRDGVSVIFSIAVSLTVANQAAAKEENTTAGKTQHWIIGVDIDQGLTVNNEDNNSSQRKGNILVSAVLKIKERLSDLIKAINRTNKKGESIVVTSGKYLSIPKRFTNDQEWKKVKEVILDKLPNAEPTAETMQLMRDSVNQEFSLNNAGSTNLIDFLNNSELDFTDLVK